MLRVHIDAIRRVKRNIGPEWEEVTGTWRKLYYEGLQDLIRLPVVIKFIRSDRGPVGEPGGGSFARIFEKKESISGSLSWTWRSLRF